MQPMTFPGHLIEQMGEQFAAQGYRLIVTCTNHNIDTEREMLQMFGSITDGILIISTVFPTTSWRMSFRGASRSSFWTASQVAVRIIKYSWAWLFCYLPVRPRFSAKGQTRLHLSALIQTFQTTEEIVSAYRDAMQSTSCGFHEDWIYYTDSDMQFDVVSILENLIKKGCNTIPCRHTDCDPQFLGLSSDLQSQHTGFHRLDRFSNKDTDMHTALSYDRIAQPLHELVELAVQQMLYLIRQPTDSSPGNTC